MDKGRILAIDYGQKSIGLAVSDTARLMAFGRGVLRNIPGEEAFTQVLLKLVNLMKVEDISLVLIGLPLGPNQEETVQTAKIRLFSEKLRGFMKISELDIPIEFIDESFSSYEANKILSGIGVKSVDQKKTEDEMAAIVLIHRYIDFKP